MSCPAISIGILGLSETEANAIVVLTVAVARLCRPASPVDEKSDGSSDQYCSCDSTSYCGEVCCCYGDDWRTWFCGHWQRGIASEYICPLVIPDIIDNRGAILVLETTFTYECE